MERVRIQFAHRNRLFRECLKSAMEARSFQAGEIDHELAPPWRDLEAATTIVFVDLGLPDRTAVDLVKHLRTFVRECRVVLLVPMHGLSETLRQRLLECVEIGVHGYLLEEASLHELARAVEQVTQGATFCSPKIVELLFADFAQLARTSGWKQRVVAEQLTRRELEVLQWMTEGLSNKQIARRLSVSLHTIKNHVHSILKKLKAEDRFAAVKLAQTRVESSPLAH